MIRWPFGSDALLKFEIKTLRDTVKELRRRLAVLQFAQLQVPAGLQMATREISDLRLELDIVRARNAAIEDSLARFSRQRGMNGRFLGKKAK